MIALILGGVGIYIGIDAKNSSASDEELADQVREELLNAKSEAKKAGEEQSAATEEAARKGKKAGKKAAAPKKSGGGGGAAKVAKVNQMF